MNRILSYLLTPVFIVVFVGILVAFHPFLVIAFYIFGYNAHKRVLEWMNVAIIWALRLIGTRFKFEFNDKVADGCPHIVVSNHQSMYDVPIILLTFRKHHPKFISKVELSRGIPSISFALRHMGSVLIQRSDQKQALAAIGEFAKKVQALGHTASIFPEGTRARDGTMKAFKPGGLITLINNMPDAQIVPVVIDGTWNILRYNFWPVPFGTRVRVRVLDPIERGDKSARELSEIAESIIRDELEKLRNTSH